ncbi:hypothetical protein OF83DRAFT_1046391, partial [Amylostereum chailletii]
ALTVTVSVSNHGKLLPFQAIYGGKTDQSSPNRTTPNYDNTINAGFLFQHSGTATYWANQATMQDFINRVIAPYFSRMKTKLGLPLQQKSIWQIDVWSVHRSLEFRDWLKKKHPTILLLFVSAGCT